MSGNPYRFGESSQHGADQWDEGYAACAAEWIATFADPVMGFTDEDENWVFVSEGHTVALGPRSEGLNVVLDKIRFYRRRLAALTAALEADRA